MTSKEFTYWLDGYLTGKSSLDKGQIASILVMLKDVADERTIIKRYNEPIPTIVPTPTGPMNPTCDTGKQLLKDEWKPDPKKTGPPKLPY